jgi:hypothetical protein
MVRPGRKTSCFAAFVSQEEVMSEEARIDATTGADLLIKALIDQDVEVVFGYPGGAVLPIYDSLF